MMVTKDFTFDAAHRLGKGYQGKCAQLHGHTYKVEVCVEADLLDKYNFVINFDDINRLMKTWVMDNMDHATLVCEDDHVLLGFLQTHKQKHCIFSNNPTAEVISSLLLFKFEELLNSEKINDRDMTIRWVRVWETPTSSAVCNG